MEGDGAVFAFPTCEANPLVAPVHPKTISMVIHAEDEEKWLTCRFDEAVDLARPFPSQLMRIGHQPRDRGRDGIGLGPCRST